MDELKFFIKLNLTQVIGIEKLKAVLNYFKTIDAAVNASKNELMKVKGISGKTADSILNATKHKVISELKLTKKKNIDILTINDKKYPKNLSNIFSPPILLYVKGKLVDDDINAVAIVGSRKATYYGLSVAEELSYKLAERGLSVVSGMARGIDTAAHKGAINAKGRTIAVLGSGFNNIYPPENEKLADNISKNGAVITEFPMDIPPYGHNFPRRNRIISGLSLGVIVVEAAKRSGSLITVDCALEQGREVFAIPGKVGSATSKGVHNLIKQGAKLVDKVDDIIEELNFPEKYDSKKKQNDKIKILIDNLNNMEKRIFSYLTEEPVHIDKLSDMAGFSSNTLLGILMKLQIKGLVKEFSGKRFVRKEIGDKI